MFVSMWRTFWTVLLSVVLGGQVVAQDGSVFDEAVAAYRASDLATAEALFAELLDLELSAEGRGEVQYNLGNVAFREGRFMDAVGRYSASVASWSRNADAWHNLELARARAGLDAADGGDLAATARRLAALPSDAELGYLAWMLVACLGVSLTLEVLRGGALWKWLAGFALVALGFDLAWMQVRALGDVEQPAMVVNSGGAELHSEPREELGIGVTAPAAERVEVLDALGLPGAPGAWIKIDSEGGIGWVRESQILVW